MKLLRLLLFPIVPFYYLVTWFRNVLYDLGIKSSKSYDFPVICVGNLSVGGTGKTPVVEYLIRLMKSENQLATLSRGYKRASKGFVLADKNSSAMAIGDEPFQFYNKFKNEVLVAVSESRQNGIEALRQHKNPPDIIVLDDAFQHRKVRAGFNILLSTYSNLYTKDWVLPVGNLREPRSGAKRADIILVTKCPKTITDIEKSKLIASINPLSHQSVFFSSINYADQVLSQSEQINIESINKNFTLVTGIANANPLIDYLKMKGLNFEHLEFKDHHQFNEDDIARLEQKEFLITTEKDYMRLKSITSLKDKLFYLPIEIDIDDATRFNKLVTDYIKS